MSSTRDDMETFLRGIAPAYGYENVVRCQHCKSYGDWHFWRKGVRYNIRGCLKTLTETKPNDYCSRAEKKGD